MVKVKKTTSNKQKEESMVVDTEVVHSENDDGVNQEDETELENSVVDSNLKKKGRGKTMVENNNKDLSLKTKRKGKKDDTEVDHSENDAEVNQEDETELENGVTDSNPKKKGRGKTAVESNIKDPSLKTKGKGKKDDTEVVHSETDAEVNQDDETELENGVEDSSPKKKGRGKKAVEKNNKDSRLKTKKKGKKDKPVAEPSRKSSRPPKPLFKNQADDEDYEVEKLVRVRHIGERVQYLVRWKGFTGGDDTWEDEEDLNCPELLKEFKAQNPTRNTAKRSASRSPSKPSKKVKSTTKKSAEKDYEVEEILGFRLQKGKKEFHIRWKGFSESDDTWEPEENLSCKDLIQSYLETHGDEVENEENKSPDKKATPKSPKKAVKGRKTKAKK